MSLIGFILLLYATIYTNHGSYNHYDTDSWLVINDDIILDDFLDSWTDDIWDKDELFTTGDGVTVNKKCITIFNQETCGCQSEMSTYIHQCHNTKSHQLHRVSSAANSQLHHRKKQKAKLNTARIMDIDSYNDYEYDDYEYGYGYDSNEGLDTSIVSDQKILFQCRRILSPNTKNTKIDQVEKEISKIEKTLKIPKINPQIYPLEKIVTKKKAPLPNEFVITITRDRNPIGKALLGKFSAPGIQGETLENNELKIKTGTYPAEFYASPKRDGKLVIQLEDRDNRRNIQIHPGNKYTHSKGCILVGSFRSTGQDGNGAVWNSKNTFDKLMTLAKNKKITVIVK